MTCRSGLDLADAIHGICLRLAAPFRFELARNDGKVRNASVLRNWFLKHTDLKRLPSGR